MHGFKNVAILNVLVSVGFMVPFVMDWFQSDNFFKAVEYVLPVQNSVIQFSVFVLKPCVNDNCAGSDLNSNNFMIFHQSCNNSTLVNLCPCDGVVIHDFVSTYVLLDLHAVYTHNLQVSPVAFGTTPPVLHFNNMNMPPPKKKKFVSPISCPGRKSPL